jgi:hypothetical protein
LFDLLDLFLGRFSDLRGRFVKKVVKLLRDCVGNIVKEGLKAPLPYPHTDSHEIGNITTHEILFTAHVDRQALRWLLGQPWFVFSWAMVAGATCGSCAGSISSSDLHDNGTTPL